MRRELVTMPSEPTTTSTTRPPRDPDTGGAGAADEADTGTATEALLRDLRTAVTGEVAAGVAARAMFSM
ncbi:hypothetical protein, partial [Saccharomonospora halophila]|uniref:hypothetical protein n=1 Tax=Saccharomonospora halophila TaxID=129922 RepID=UPI0018DD2A54